MKKNQTLLSLMLILSLFFPVLPLWASDLLVTAQISGNVLRYDGTTGNFIEEFIPSGTGGLTEPDGITFGSNGNVFVLDININQALEFNGGTGDFIGNLGPSGPTGDCLEFGPDGNFYACDFQNNQVFQITPQGNSVAFITGIDGPEGLDFDNDGNIYVGGCNESAVRRFNGATGQLIDVFVASGAGGLSCPVGVLFGPDGNLYVSDLDNNTVLRYNGTSGAFIDVFVSAGSGGLMAAFGMLFRSDGNLYVASNDTDSVLRYNSTTGAFIDAFIPSGSGGMNGPLYLAVFPAGDLQFSMANYTVNEADGSATIELTRTNGANGEVSVQFATSDGTAVAGTDYTAVSETLTFAAGETSQTVSIPILQNTADTANKTVNLTLSNATNDAVLGDPDTAILTIEDDDISGDGCRLQGSPSNSAGIHFLCFGILLIAGLRISKIVSNR